jgi:hypothetical protein
MQLPFHFEGIIAIGKVQKPVSDDKNKHLLHYIKN